MRSPESDREGWSDDHRMDPVACHVSMISSHPITQVKARSTVGVAAIPALLSGGGGENIPRSLGSAQLSACHRQTTKKVCLNHGSR